MRVVAITLAGGSRKEIIGDAIRSALDVCDDFLLLRTDDTADAAIEVAQAIAGAERCHVRDAPLPTDCGLSRTIGLQLAGELGADWAMVLDTDERLVPHGEDLRGLLATTDKRVVVMIREETQADAKERFIRLPAQGKYVGAVHEYYSDMSSRLWVRRATFSELVKTPEQIQAAAPVIEQRMLRQIAEDPDNSRWSYYLGDARWAQENYLGALEAWQEVPQKAGPEDQKAWACVRSAACCAMLGNHQGCLQWSSEALVHHAGMAEASWLAAQASLNLGRARQAVYWCHYAIMAGRFKGFGSDVETRTYALTKALYEAPFETLAVALDALGSKDRAAAARADARAALKARIGLAAAA